MYICTSYYRGTEPVNKFKYLIYSQKEYSHRNLRFCFICYDGIK